MLKVMSRLPLQRDTEGYSGNGGALNLANSMVVTSWTTTESRRRVAAPQNTTSYPAPGHAASCFARSSITLRHGKCQAPALRHSHVLPSKFILLRVLRLAPRLDRYLSLFFKHWVSKTCHTSGVIRHRLPSLRCLFEQRHTEYGDKSLSCRLNTLTQFGVNVLFFFFSMLSPVHVLRRHSRTSHAWFSVESCNVPSCTTACCLFHESRLQCLFMQSALGRAKLFFSLNPLPLPETITCTFSGRLPAWDIPCTIVRVAVGDGPGIPPDRYTIDRVVPHGNALRITEAKAAASPEQLRRVGK